MRRLLLVAGLVMATAGYIAWPFHTAWSIREAVKSGDSAYLARHFEWTHRISSQVPTYSLDYPRDYGMLSHVRDLVCDHIPTL